MRIFWMVAVVFLLSGCGYGRLTEQKASLTAKWAEIEALHAERASLAGQWAGQLANRNGVDARILAKVSQASRQAKELRVNAADEASLRSYEKVQDDVLGALAELTTAMQAVPHPGTHDVLARLESTNNRLRTAKGHYAASVSTYNAGVDRTWAAALLGFAPVPQIRLESPQPVDDAPVIDFAKSPSPRP